jgi:hypothetical protein
VIYKYEEGNTEHEAWSKAKHVPADRVVAHLEGNWMKEVRYRLKGEKVGGIGSCDSERLRPFLSGGVSLGIQSP